MPNTAARNLVMQRPQAVGFIVHEPHSLFLEDPNIGAHPARRQRRALRRRPPDGLPGRRLRPRHRAGRPLPPRRLRRRRDHRLGARARPDRARCVERLRLPAAFVGHPPGLRRLAFVGIDNRGLGPSRSPSGSLATGRRRVGMIAAALDRDSGRRPPRRLPRCARRRASTPRWSSACRSTPTPPASRACARCSSAPPTSTASSRPPTPSPPARWRCCATAGRRVPDDVGVVGFDDSAWALRTQPPLSTVHQPAEGLGREAAELVLAPAARRARDARRSARHGDRLARVGVTQARAEFTPATPRPAMMKT